MQVEDDADARRIDAVLGALGWEVERVDDLRKQLEHRIEAMAERAPDSMRAVVHGLLVTDDADGLARMLGVSRETAIYRSEVVFTAIGRRSRIEMLRELAGIDRSEVMYA